MGRGEDEAAVLAEELLSRVGYATGPLLHAIADALRAAEARALERAALPEIDRVLSEAREMLGVMEDHGGHDGLQGKGLIAVLDHIDERRKAIRSLFTPSPAEKKA